MTSDAKAIARKLGAEIELKRASHAIAIVRVNGKESVVSGFAAA